MIAQALSSARGLRRGGVALAVAILVAGCASANKTVTETASAPTGSASVASSSSSMAGMQMGASSVPTANGIKPVPTQMLASTTWQGMKIKAMAMTAIPFVIFDGTSERLVKPPPHASFHLMVMLNDAYTNEPIPYAGVWATIRKAGKIVFDERQWPMISRYIGPHYGNDVALPGSGTYQLSLLISPPVAARHVEYEHVWLHQHRISLTFHWRQPS